MEKREPTMEELRAQFKNAAASLQGPTFAELTSASQAAATQAFAAMLDASFSMLSASIGECRVQAPYASLRPVIDARGQFRWCCTHEVEHCAPPIE